MSGVGEGPRHPYQYVVVRCVPRVDREEFVNLGVVLYCQATDFLGCSTRLEPDRLAVLWPHLDVERVADALAFVTAVCEADPRAGAVAEQSLTLRFGFLKAPRSTVLQPGPVHGGTTTDPAAELAALLERCC